MTDSTIEITGLDAVPRTVVLNGAVFARRATAEVDWFEGDTYCTACSSPVSPADAFCAACGSYLRPVPAAGAAEEQEG